MLKKTNLLDITIAGLFLLTLFLAWHQYANRRYSILPHFNRQHITNIEIAYPNGTTVQFVQKSDHWLMTSPTATASINHPLLDNLLDIIENLSQADLVSQSTSYFTNFKHTLNLKVTYSTPKRKGSFLLKKVSPYRGGTFIQCQQKAWLVPIFFSPPSSASGWLRK